MWHDAMTTPEGGSPDSPEAQHCPTVRVVVRCGTREAETDVPSERPIEELVPDLIRAVCRDDDSSVASQLPWSVSVRGDRPLPATTTLADHAVADGGVLQLQQVSQWEPPAAGRPPADPGRGPWRRCRYASQPSAAWPAPWPRCCHATPFRPRPRSCPWRRRRAPPCRPC